MDKKIGFIGAGKMAGAIIKGLLNANVVSPKNIIATQIETETIEERSKELGISIIQDNTLLAKNSDIIFVATKPNQVEDVLKEISPYITSDKLIVSIAAGVTTERLEAYLPKNTRVIRVMPNTPALVGLGMSALFGGKFAFDDDIKTIQFLLNTIGKTIVVDEESQMDIVTAISGSGPAFFYKIINEIALAGEKLGLDYDKALLLSIQTALGSAQMALNRNVSMETLVANVATKGGCTRVGVDCMDEHNTESLFEDVIRKTTQKACELGK